MPLPDTQGNCRSYYSSYGGSCYRVMTTGTTWTAAQVQCVTDGGTLAIVNDVYEDNYIQALVGDKITNYWIGLSDTKVPD